MIVEEYVTKGGVITEESKQLNFYNVQIRKGRKIVAHVSCNYSDKKIQIRDLYVLKKYRKTGLGDVLLSKVFEYAAEKKAQTIVAYCGPEPFCEDAQIPLNEEIAFYISPGFVHDHNVMGVTPCMVRELPPQDTDESEGRMRILSQNPRFNETAESKKTIPHGR